MPDRLTVAACERFITAAKSTCAANAVPQAHEVASPAQPTFDALGLAVAQQNNLIATAAILIAVIGLLAGLGWGILVKLWAERSAREAAREWMELNAGDIIADLAPPLYSGPDAGGGSPLTPNEQAEQLENEGEAPAQ
jgi:hypothetical protein